MEARRGEYYDRAYIRKTETGGNQLSSLFVDNIPTRASLLWVNIVFSRFRKVVDVFIPRKKNRQGMKFAFVRFKYRQEAERAIWRMNSTWIEKHCLSVNMVKYESRDKFWRKKKEVRMQGTEVKIADDTRRVQIGSCGNHW